MDTRLIIVRHAQGEGNLKEEFHGQYNSDLTPLGHEQAECTARFLRDYDIDCAFSSDIARAYSTACHAAKFHGLDVKKAEGLREINAGKWEQVRFTDIQKNYPGEHRAWTTDMGNFTCPGGESVRHLQSRVNETIQSLVKSNAGKSILVATHATPIRAMLCIWQQLDISDIVKLRWVPNASVTVVEYDSKDLSFRLDKYAMCEHLKTCGLLTKLPKII